MEGTNETRYYTLEQKVDAAKVMVKLFNAERWSYFVISSISVLALLSLAVIAVQKDEIDLKVFFGLVTSAGGVIYSAGLILKMFSNCMEFLQSELK